MAPGAARFDSIDVLRRNAVVLSDRGPRLAGRESASNHEDLIGLELGRWMELAAVVAIALAFRAIAGVVGLCAQIEMAHARRVSTPVQDEYPVGDRSMLERPAVPMRKHELPADADDAIAALIAVPGPNPALA